MYNQCICAFDQVVKEPTFTACTPNEVDIFKLTNQFTLLRKIF